MDNTAPKIKDPFRTTRIAYILESMFEYMISIATSGVYLAKLTTTIGISDAMTAILSSVASLAAMFQIFSILLAHKTPVKRWVFPMTVIPQALVCTLYLIPFLDIGAAAPILFLIITLTNQAAHNIVAPAKLNWFFSPIAPNKRGDFQAKTSIVSIIGGTLFTFVAGLTIDKLEAAGETDTLFIILTTVIFALAVMQMLCLLVAKEGDTKADKNKSPFKSAKALLSNKAFIHIIIINALWSIANSITTPFLSTYQIKELGFSMTFISTVTIVLSFLNILAVFLAGKYSIKHSYTSLFIGSYIFGLIGFGFIIFTTTANGYFMFTAYRVFNLFFGAAAGISATGLVFSFVKESERTSALAFKSILTGLFGFITTLVVSPIFADMQLGEIKLFGTTLFAQQVLSIISFVITLLILLYYVFICRKIFSKEQE